MDVGVVWGIVFCIYVAAGIPALALANNGARPKDTIPGSRRLKEWEEKEAKADKWLKIWCVGFGLLLAIWYIATKL